MSYFCRFCGKVLTTADDLDRCNPICSEKSMPVFEAEQISWDTLKYQNDQLKAENERLREALREIAEDNSYREDTDNEVGWHIDNAYEVMNKLKLKSKQALKEVKE